MASQLPYHGKDLFMSDRTHTLKTLLALVTGGLLFSACNSNGGPTSQAVVVPSISSFTATQSTIAPGASTTLTWKVNGTAPVMSIAPGVGTVTGTSYVVAPTSSTTYTLTATNSAGQVSKIVTVTVTGTTNQAPTVTASIAAKNVTQGAAAQTIDLKTVFNDAEDGSAGLAFSATSSSLSVVSPSISGSSLTLNFGAAGSTQVTLSAKDSGDLSVSTSFNVTVASNGSGPVNQAPVVSSPIANKNVTQGATAQNFNLKTVFNDAEDGTNLTFSAVSSNTNVASTSVSSGVLTLTFVGVGTAQVTLSAKDSGNLSTSSSFSVTVASSGGGNTGGGGTSNCISSNFMTVLPYAGNSSLPDPTLSVTCSNGKATVATNAIPNHVTGSFPNANNPNKISAQTRSYPVSLSPTVAASATVQTKTLMGVAVNGIAFEPMANEYYNNDSTSGWQYEALALKTVGKGKNLGLDDSNAHVQPTGNYHYHGLPQGLVNLLGKGTNMTLIGYIGDGFPVYAVYGYSTANDASSATREIKSSYQIKTGTRPSGPGGSYDGTFIQDYEYVSGLGDLDACNGRYGVTPEYPNGIYHYYITKSYPFIPRCFSGTPNSYYVSTPPTN